MREFEHLHINRVLLLKGKASRQGSDGLVGDHFARNNSTALAPMDCVYILRRLPFEGSIACVLRARRRCLLAAAYGEAVTKKAAARAYINHAVVLLLILIAYLAVLCRVYPLTARIRH